MQIVTTIVELRGLLDSARSEGRTVGVVPTMGALHPGHAALVDRAAAECDTVAVTVFVNPLQFAAGEDLDSYPRDLDGDVQVAGDHGADLVFAPSETEMYPAGRDRVLSEVRVALLSDGMEGAQRPTHFAGVCTVVAKLFNIVGPANAYFGEKDFQQLTIIRRMVDDLSFPVTVVGCPTVRETDGLAMSSRNVRLSPDHRAQAPVLAASLADGAAAFADGERSADALVRIVEDRLADAPDGQVDYVAVVDPATLEPVGVVDRSSRLVLAVRFGGTRLLDNAALGDPPRLAGGSVS